MVRFKLTQSPGGLITGCHFANCKKAKLTHSVKCVRLINVTFKQQEGLAVASIVRGDPSPLPGMHRDHNALPSQTDGH